VWLRSSRLFETRPPACQQETFLERAPVAFGRTTASIFCADPKRSTTRARGPYCEVITHLGLLTSDAKIRATTCASEKKAGAIDPDRQVDCRTKQGPSSTPPSRDFAPPALP